MEAFWKAFFRDALGDTLKDSREDWDDDFEERDDDPEDYEDADDPEDWDGGAEGWEPEEDEDEDFLFLAHMDEDRRLADRPSGLTVRREPQNGGCLTALLLFAGCAFAAAALLRALL